MTPASVRASVLIFVLSGSVAWAGLDLWTSRGGISPGLPWTAVVALVGLAIAVIAAGMPVRRWVRGDRDRALDPLVAARTVVFAKAAAYGGALLAGWYTAQGLELLPDLVGVRRTRFWLAVAAASASVAVAVAGHVVQRWCQVPPDEPEPPE